LGKASRLIFSYLVVVLLIGIVLLSATQQVLPTTKQTRLLPSYEDSAATYTNMTYSTYFGGNEGLEQGRSITISDDGSYYFTGRTESSDFPTKNAYDSTYNGGSDAYITKFSPDNSLLWSTFFGGSDLDNCIDIAVGRDGSCYIIGTTLSGNFPTKKAYDSSYSGTDDVFLAKFSTNGVLLWSTYLGGSEWDFGYSIAVACDGSCYVIGETHSSDFPIKDAYDNTFNGGYFDAFVTKFSSNGRLLWSSYLGGNENDAGNAIAVTYDGSCYVTGRSRSSNFPTLNAYDAIHNGDWDVFVTKFSSNGKLLWSTFLGGAWWDEGLGITVARDDSCYVAGFTQSTDFPTKQAYNSTKGRYGDAFVSRFAANGSLLWSTFLGGNDTDRAFDIAAAVDCSCYVTGNTYSINFPTPNAYDNSNNDGWDAFVVRFATNGSLLWGTYLGGSEGGDKGYGVASTEDGKCYVIGTTLSDDFPTKNAYDTTLGSTSDAFITAFIDPFPPIPYPEPICPLVSSFSILYGILAFLGITFFVVIIIYTRKK